MVNLRNKKAVSPVIATIMLVLLVIVLAAIIVLWGTTFIPEALTKFDRPIEEKCNEVKFSAELSEAGAASKISVVNEGSVPIYKFSVRKQSSSESTVTTTDSKNLLPGSSVIIDADTSSLSSGDEIDIIPILLGKTKSNKIQENQCSQLSWQVIEMP